MGMQLFELSSRDYIDVEKMFVAIAEMALIHKKVNDCL